MEQVVVTGTPEDPHAGVSRSPVELAREVIASDECLECHEYGNGRMEELARALLVVEGALFEITHTPSRDWHLNARIARAALSVLRGSE